MKKRIIAMLIILALASGTLWADTGGLVATGIGTLIGGVFVLPEYRNRGVAGRLTAELSAELSRRGRNVTLFVKTWNAAARAAYVRAGFVKTGEYRICYY
jgi:predicted GNAT family acetyltransferase